MADVNVIVLLHIVKDLLSRFPRLQLGLFLAAWTALTLQPEFVSACSKRWGDQPLIAAKLLTFFPPRPDEVGDDDQE